MRRGWLTRRDRVPWRMRRRLTRGYRVPGTGLGLLWAGPLIIVAGLVGAAVHAPGWIVVKLLDVLILLFFVGLVARAARRRR
jgi:uncharacterized membrane protein